MRARSIKPGFFDNEILAENGPCAQILFAGLWCLADKAGRLEDRPKRIKAKIFPYYEPNPTVEELLHLIESQGFINRYEVNGSKIISIINFIKHQSPHHTEKESDLPECPPEQNGGITVSSPLSHGYGTVEIPLTPDSLTPDSLTPDSLTPDSGSFQHTLSGKPDEACAETDAVDEDPVQYEPIVEHLNKQTGKAYRPQSDQTRRVIKARWHQGFRLQDFVTVIDTKVAQWLHNPDRQRYLRPETLFGPKFESYLNESRVSAVIPAGVVSEITRRTIANLEDWRPPDERREQAQEHHGRVG